MRLSRLGDLLRWVFGGSFVAKVITSLGFSVVIYTGITAILNYLMDMVIDTFTDLPLEVMSLMGYYNVDIAINIIFSAYTTVIVITSTQRFLFNKSPS